jgi:hypothetical protein
LAIGANSHEVHAVEMTDHCRGGTEILPGLLAQLPEDEQIAVISGDGAIGKLMGDGRNDQAGAV